ncbi:MAG: MurR/RpiR family transcriptional regulator [Ruthenibacterium sp.]
MEQPDILAALTAEYNSLTKSAKKIADYIFANATEAQYMSITTMAEECGVADATISRFCRTLGFSGYNDFKLALAKASGASVSDGDDMGLCGKVLPQDSITDMCRKLYATDVAAIGQTLSLVREDSVARAVQYMARAQRVFCFGQGGSLVIAMEMWARFLTAAPQFQCIEDAHMQAMAASLCTVNDVIVFFSYSGATKDMLDVLRPARARGAKIILVTHFEKSPAAAYADVTLLCGSKEGPLQSGSVAAKMSFLFLIDILFAEYCRTQEAFTGANREATTNAVSGKLL